jgi:hypothetical protein
MKTKLAVAFAVAAVAAGAIFLHAAGPMQTTAAGGFTKSVEVDRGTYFRLKVKFAYKGEPQDFDIVVGCNVRQTNYKDNSRTVEVGMIPQVFGRRMSDGKAVVIRPPQACRGETTANGWAQPDLLPIIIVYDDADTLAFGTAYLSEDAYESPLSELKFGGATIEKSTATEFGEFRSTQQNVVTHRIYHRQLKEATLPGAKDIPRWGDICVGYVRYRLPEDISALVRAQWPEEKPRYWIMGDGEAQTKIFGTLSLSKRVQSDTDDAPIRSWHELAASADSTVADLGLATRRGGGQIFPRRGSRFPPAFYPDTDGWGPLPWPRDPIAAAKHIFLGNSRIQINVDYRSGAMRGFGDCRRDVAQYESFANPTFGKYGDRPASNRIDGQEISISRPRNSDSAFFERDEFLFRIFQIGISSLFGDV